MRRSSYQHHVAVGILGETRNKLVALVATATAFAAVGAGVGFVYNDKFGATALEFFAAAVALDKVGRDNYEGVNIEKGLTEGAVAFQTIDGAGKHQFSLDVEFFGEFGLPLFGKLGWTEDGDTFDFAPIQKFASDQ